MAGIFMGPVPCHLQLPVANSPGRGSRILCCPVSVAYPCRVEFRGDGATCEPSNFGIRGTWERQFFDKQLLHMSSEFKGAALVGVECTSCSPSGFKQLKHTHSAHALATGVGTDVPATNAETKIHKSILSLVGNTPMVYLNRTASRCCGRIACKLEAFEPCRSVKDRIALAMVEDAEKKGLIKPGVSTLVEATSGNFGIGMALVCASKGYKLILTMPEDQSIERRILVQAFGAQVVLTPARAAMTGAIRKAEEIVKRTPNSYSLEQFSNPANPRVHFETTGPEIWRDTKGKVDILVAGVGTGGTITGCGEYLKRMNKYVQVVAVEPSESAIISGGKAGYHQIQGIGAGFVPEVLDLNLLDEVLKVSSRDAFSTARKLHQEEGLMVGISSGAATHAAIQIAQRSENKGKLIVCVLPSFGERYLSTPLFKNAWKDNFDEERKVPLNWLYQEDLDEQDDGPGGGALTAP